MLDIILVLILSAVFIGLVVYGIRWLRDAKAEEFSLNKESYAEFRTNCLRMILRSIGTGFCVEMDDMTIEQNQSDWNYNWVSIIFDDWIVWFTINWKTKMCKITCMYERDDHETFIKKLHFRIIHNTINEALIIHRITEINKQAYKFALPNDKARATAAIKDAYSLATAEEINDEQLFDIMYNAWTRLPYKDKRDAEDFVRITAFLFRNHLEEMKDRTKIEAEKKDR